MDGLISKWSTQILTTSDKDISIILEQKCSVFRALLAEDLPKKKRRGKEGPRLKRFDVLMLWKQ